MKKLYTAKHPGVSLIESLLMIVIIVTVFSGVFNTVAASMKLRLHSQVDLDGCVLANSCFMAIDAWNANSTTAKVKHESSMKDALKDTLRWSPISSTARPPKYSVGRATLTFSISYNSTYEYSDVTLEITRDDLPVKKTQTFKRRFNTYGTTIHFIGSSSQ